MNNYYKIWNNFINFEKFLESLEKDFFERLFLIQTKDLFKFNNTCLIQTKYFWPNKYLFKANKFIFKINECIDTWSIYLIWGRIYLIWTNVYLVQRYIVWIKQILFYLNKSFFLTKKIFQTNNFLWFNQIFFSECDKIAIFNIYTFYLQRKE